MTTTPPLRNGHTTVSGPDSDGPDLTRPVSAQLETYYEKHEALRDIPATLIRKAWFTMSHLLVQPGATVVDMGPNPMMTFAMATLNPRLNFIGVDNDKKMIGSAKKTWQAPNLEFRAGNVNTMAGFEEESVDAIINSFILHEIYSAHKFHDRSVIAALEHHLAILKKEGLMFIRDYAMPPPEQYVLMEMPDADSKSEAIADMSEADLLVWYSEHARPQGGNFYKGFFLEELPPRFPQTRLFRLPYKWAYEFIMRKDDRDLWQEELHKEYTFFTQREYRKNLRSIGARALYTAPQWDDAIIRERFEGRFRLYSDDGKTLGAPPTSFIAVAQKMGEKSSLYLQELRPSPSMDSKIRITAMRNEATGKIFDVISRDMDVTEVIPYRVTPEGDLNIFIHDGLPRGIANAVPRTGKELDGKRWSGHMTEAIAVPTAAVYEAEQGEPKATVLFTRDYLGLKPAMGGTLEQGTLFYPAPDLIDEQIKTRYIRVAEHEGIIEPRYVTADLEGFSTKGHIREVNAQSVLNAISVGYIPNARLETQILDLYAMLGLKAETWDECPLALEDSEPEAMMDMRALLNQKIYPDKRFKDVKGNSGEMRNVKSIFVDEGWAEGGITGLTSCDIDFVIADDKTINKAVILPLTKHARSGDILAGLVSEYLPVPQRHTGNGLSLRAPSFTLPKEITSIDQAKRFIADKFSVAPEKVARLGESYFCHIGVTPVRIFPFAVASTGSSSNPFGGPVTFAPLVDLVHLMWRFDDWKQDRYILSRFEKVYRLLHGSEIKGSWERSSQKIYSELANAAPAVMNSTDITGIGAAPSAQEQKPETQSPLAAVVSKGKSAQAPASYISSPDFIDIQHDSGVGGATYATSEQQDVANTNDNSKKDKYKTK